MDLTGLALASRYSYPPNSLSLCGPAKASSLAWYSQVQQPDRGTAEILSQFATLYPYLRLIAAENRLTDPFDRRVVEAYWLGNRLLSGVGASDFIRHLDEAVGLGKKEPKPNRERIYTKVAGGGLPNHAFHVLNVYKRTGHQDIPHTIATMDACLINWGRVKQITPAGVAVESRPLRRTADKLGFGQPMLRLVRFQGKGDVLAKTLAVGDWVSYHWGYFCQKLTKRELTNLRYFTRQALSFANSL